MDILELPLPRAVERSDCLSRVRGLLSARVRRLWSGGDLEIPVLVFTRPLQDALRSVRSRGNLRRGLESVEDRLEAERIGLLKVSRGAEREPRERISRLILLSNDGSDRFYRKAEKILIRYAPRVLAVILDADSHTLGRFLFGADSSVKLMMVDHKDSVALVLLSLAGEECSETAAEPGEVNVVNNVPPIRELLNRIRWDEEFGRGVFEVGYCDHVQGGIVRIPFEEVKWGQGNRFSFEVETAEGEIRSIPFHRVREVFRDGVLIWKREKGMGAS